MDDLKNKTDEELDGIMGDSASNAYVPGSIFHTAGRETDRGHRKKLEFAAMRPQTFIESNDSDASVKNNIFVNGPAVISQGGSDGEKVSLEKIGLIVTVAGSIVVPFAIYFLNANSDVSSGDTYYVSSENQGGGITAGKLEINNGGTEAPLEKPDGVLREFTFVHRPREVVVDQSRSMVEGQGWSYSEGIVTLEIAPNFDIYGRF